ncbi:hypothetical protein Slin15195_G064120 [Septoria linicola]|uniref:Uncharacterized protein n=1 Tax=Septoria linicola TaxID=215465 RepID=A0A9Q9ATV3_9PEZI|nr:hypothetical protein Slin15195_G064120 [Septoria linicola]
MADKPVVYVPVKLDAFVLNQFSSKGFPNNASLAPLSQPNYTFLRLDAGLIQNDVLPYHDISHASPATINPRMTDLGTGSPKKKRQGVYLHWMLPRCYRAGTAAKTDSVPEFKTAPDRWLVLRRLHPGEEPANVVRDGRMKEITAWIVESNRVRNVQEFDKNVDAEVDCAPYLKGDLGSIDGQAEVYIGQKTLLTPGSWKEAAPNAEKFVPLGALNTANPLFADYAPHCSNVFSILDNFEYNSGTGKSYLTKATASYTVLGWHGEEAQDFLTNPGALSMADLLARSFLTMPTARSDEFLNRPSSGRVLCHGSMYTINYSAQDATLVQPSADAAKKFANAKSHPVTIGTTPLDSVLSYVRAYNDSLKQGGSRDTHLDETQADILHLETLLLKQEDDIDSQQEAHDMLSAKNFEPCQDSGSFWSFSAAVPREQSSTVVDSRTQKLFQPTLSQKQDLQKLNNFQTIIDATKRELKSEQWNLFALWWKYVSSKPWQDLRATTDSVSSQIKLVKAIRERVDSLTTVLPSLLQPFSKPGTDTTMPAFIVEQNSRKRFYTQRDPSILVPGLANPWPADWLLPLPTRLSSQVQIPELPGQLPSGWGTLRDVIDTTISSCFSGASQTLRSAALALVREFFNLRPNDVPEAASFVRGQPKVLSPPHYHDGRDAWNNTQAWFPLFLEWEARYCHVPWSAWDFNQVSIPFRPNENPRVRYGIRPDQSVASLTKNQAGTIKDEREIDGRVLILPQPGFSLRVNIEQLLSSTSEEDLPDHLRPVLDPNTGELVRDPAVKFLEDVDQIQLLSAPMTGFMDHLVTRLLGTHIKPTVRDPLAPNVSSPLKGAEKGEVGLNNEAITLMGFDLDKTPFSDFVPFDSGVSPLKPVTHGQFRLTKLNIIDKFGQAISALDPRPSNNIPPLYPNLSEYFHPQSLGSDVNRDNVIIEDPAGCQFAQYPPTINQDARLNGSFMLYDTEQKMWRPAGDWDDPVWGFVVLNYAENGVQIFLPDGQFYREVRLGGPSKATQSIEWQPFEPPSDSQAKASDPKVYRSKGYAQLDALMQQLSKPEYLRSFFIMVNKALAALPQAPNHYAEYLNAIIGRPLALTNIGFSLELASPPFQNQSTLSSTPAEIALTNYNFTVKVGDRDRAYDGLVCLFKQKGDARAVPGHEIDLSTMITYYPAGKDRSTTALDRSQYFDLNPYHVSSRSYKLDQRDPLAATKEINLAMNDHYSQFTRLGALIDPFAKIHAYSGILPITTLQLPSWTLQSAMQRMTAFFRMGPLIVTTPDVQSRYDASRDLSTESNVLELVAAAKPLAPAPATGAVPPVEVFSGIPLPALASADWNWLQPYAMKPAESSGDSTGATKEKAQHWNPFPIASLDNKPRFEAGPYTAVEGFLQLKRPVMEGKV